MEAAALGLKVTGVDSVDRATRSLDGLANSSDKAERSQEGLGTQSKKSGANIRTVGTESDTATKGVNSLAKAARVAASALALVGAGIGTRSIVSEIANFQGAINGLAAVSNATARQMADLESQARSLGATSKFSAQQAAEGQRFLAQAGFEVNEILSATPGILQLATAGELGLAEAADIASNVLGGMRLEVDQLNRVNDVLAATAARSNTSIQQLGQALSFAAPFAAGAGIEIEEVAAAIGVMSDAGIQASRAGTGMVGVIRQLSKVTTEGEKVLGKYGLSVDQVNIEARGLTPVLETLRGANLNTADAIALFGSEAGAAAQILVNDYKGAIEGATGESERMESVMSQGLTPAFLSLKSAISESVLQMGDSGLAGGLESLVRNATGVISVWNGMGETWAEANGVGEESLETIESIASGLVTGAKLIAAYAVATSTATAANVAYTATLKLASAAQTAFNRVLMINPFVAIASAIAAAGYALYAFRDSMASFGGEAHRVGNLARATWEVLSETVKEAWSSVVDLVVNNPISLHFIRQAESMIAAASWLSDNFAEPMGEAFGFVVRALRTTTNQMIGIFYSLGQTVGIVAGAIREQFTSAFDSVLNIAAGYWESLTAVFSGDLSFSAFRNALKAEIVDPLAGMSQEIGRTFSENLQRDFIGEGIELVAEGFAGASTFITGTIDDILDRSRELGKELDYLANELEDVPQTASGSWDDLENVLDDTKGAVGGVSDELLSFAESLMRVLDPMGTFEKEAQKIQDVFDKGLLGDTTQTELDAYIDKLREAAEAAAGINQGFDFAALESGLGGAVSELSKIQGAMADGSKGAKELADVMTALSVAQGVAAIANAMASGDPYTAVARAIAVAATLAQAGINTGVSGGGNIAEQRQETQGTGTVLGMAYEKSESIERSSDITATATSELVGINRDMLTALRGLREGISGATVQITRGASGLDFDYEGQIRVTENILGGITRITDQLGALGGGLMEKIGKLLGGSSKVTDEGVRILGGAMSDMMEGAVLQAFQETQSKRYAWSSTRTSTAFEGLDDNVNAQFQLVFSGIASSVMAGAEALGLSAKEIDRAINEFEVSTQLISLKDLDAQEQQAELEAVFSSIFDGLTDFTAPFLRDLQNVGEGLGETLARVATNVQVTEEAIFRLGFNAERLGVEQFAELSTALIDASGGLEQFLSGMSSFVDRFASEAHQFEIAQNDMARAFDQIGLAVPETREQMWSLMQTLDANTDAGRRQIATILELSATADDYYRSLEQQQRETIRAMEEQQREAIRGVEEIARALQSEISGIGSAAQRLRGDLGEGSSARNDAIELLRSAMTSGDLAGAGRAAQTAAQISASDFSSAEEFRREQARTLFLLDSLEREGNQQLSTAEQSLNVLENIDGGIDSINTTMGDLADAIRHDRPDDVVRYSASQRSSSKDLQREQVANDELIKEIKDIKNYIRQTMKNTGESRDQLRNWNRQGLPEERELV